MSTPLFTSHLLRKLETPRTNPRPNLRKSKAKPLNCESSLETGGETLFKILYLSFYFPALIAFDPLNLQNFYSLQHGWRKHSHVGNISDNWFRFAVSGTCEVSQILLYTFFIPFQHVSVRTSHVRGENAVINSILDGHGKTHAYDRMPLSFLPCCSADDATRSEDESGPSTSRTGMKDASVSIPAVATTHPLLILPIIRNRTLPRWLSHSFRLTLTRILFSPMNQRLAPMVLRPCVVMRRFRWRERYHWC